jgi:transposase-like protein
VKSLDKLNDKVYCPRCDRQGFIYKAKIIDMDICLYICDECDAIWKDQNSICIESYEDLQTYLERNNSVYSNTNIIELGYDWHNFD